MPVSANWYGKALEGQFGATSARRIDWLTDTIKAALCTSSYSPDQDAHTFFSDITNEIPGGNGYTAGGVSLGTKSINYDPTGNIMSLRAGTSSWSAASFTARYAVVYKDTGTAATSSLLGYVDFGSDQTVNNGTFSIIWDATEGVLKITAA